MERPIIIALDFSTKKETEAFLQHFSGESLFVKVGMELFFQEGPSLLKELKERGHRIFLDVKLHDIPNTVYRTMRGLARFDIDLITVHAAGGTAMMKAALKGLAEGKAWGRKRTRCVAVTQLTSMTEEEIRKEQRIPLSLTESVVHYAKLARDAGLDGVISSVHEAPHIRKACGETFHIITPVYHYQMMPVTIKNASLIQGRHEKMVPMPLWSAVPLREIKIHISATNR